VRIIAVCLALTLASLARAADVDWKMYGSASLALLDGGVLSSDRGVFCFYDANGITPTADRHLRVWTKCLLLKDLHSVDMKDELGGKIVKNTARKVLDKYVPPFAVVENVDFNQALAVIQYEETANLGGIQPRTQIFYELNCSERMTRTLSISVQVDGSRDSFDNKPSNWEYVPPETNGARLLKILCR
jgi:hypothetical protein